MTPLPGWSSVAADRRGEDGSASERPQNHQEHVSPLRWGDCRWDLHVQGQMQRRLLTLELRTWAVWRQTLRTPCPPSEPKVVLGGAPQVFGLHSLPSLVLLVSVGATV